MAESNTQELQSGTSPTFNPLQSSHSHMYFSQRLPQRHRQKGATNPENIEKGSGKGVGTTANSDSYKAKQRMSRYGIFGFFSRNKSSDIEVPEPKLDVQWEREEDGREINRDFTDVSFSNSHIFSPQPDSEQLSDTQNTGTSLPSRSPPCQ